VNNEVDSELVELEPIEEVGAYINREAPVWVIIDDQDGDDSREQAIFDTFIATMLDGGEIQTLWTYGAEGVHWSVSADDGFTTNAGTENEKVYGPYEEGTFHLLPSPSDENTVWKKNAMDPALVICPLVGDYASYTDISSLAAEGNAFFTSHMKDAPTSPSSEVYTNYAGDIQTARKECIAAVVNDGVSVDDAMQTYIDTVGYMVDESLADLNAQ
jgi:multiple sugar transport system substrate-binding protein/putative aldouronate transport system substrate-binding protein